MCHSLSNPTVAHRGHATYIFISRDNLDLSRDNLNLSRDNSQFIARYENVSSVTSMGHRTNRIFRKILVNSKQSHTLVQTRPSANCRMCHANISLRSKRLLARFVKKAGTRAKKENDGGGGGERRNLFSPPLPLQLFLCFRSNFRAITRLETLATQATLTSSWKVVFKNSVGTFSVSVRYKWLINL